MDEITLGRINLTTTAAGLGTGGASRIGIAKYGTEHASSIVKTAYDEGVRFFDSAEVYRTEEALGNGLIGIPRNEYVLSSKFRYENDDGEMITPLALSQKLDDSLRRLRTDTIDIFHIHGVAPEHYKKAAELFVPVLQKAKKDGKIRAIGITERFGSDTTHEMLKMALADDFFDSVMVGYNILNPSAADTIFPITREKNVTVLCMFAVRTALSHPEQLKVDIGRILEKKQGDPSILPLEGTLDFLMENGIAGSIMEAAYRFARHTSGIHVTLTGTGSAEHLLDNIRAINAPPLPESVLKKLSEMFGKVDCISGQ